MLWNLISQGVIKGFRGNIHLVDFALLRKCMICGVWKMHATFLHSDNPPVFYHRPGARFDADFKTFKITFFGKVNTVVVLVDAYTKKSFSYWLFYPTEATPNLFLEKVFKTFYSEVCLPNQWLHFVFHPDNAKTFLSGAMIQFCNEKSIIIDPSVKYKSSTNGNAESTLKVICNAAMCNLAASRLHRATFPFAWNHAEDIANDLGSAPSYLSPNFKTDGSECQAHNHRTYGSRCFILQHAVNKPSTNLTPPGTLARWLGFEKGHRTKNKVLVESTNTISSFATGDITFDECNTEAHNNEQDMNEQLQFLDEIDGTTTLPSTSITKSTEPLLLAESSDSTVTVPLVEPSAVASAVIVNKSAASIFCSTYGEPFVPPAGCYQISNVCIIFNWACLKLCFA